MFDINAVHGVTVELFVSKNGTAHTLELTYENKIANAVILPFVTELKGAKVFVMDILSEANSQWHIHKNISCDLTEIASQVCDALNEAKLPFNTIATYATVNHTLKSHSISHISNEIIQDIVNTNSPLDVEDRAKIGWNSDMLEWLK